MNRFPYSRIVDPFLSESLQHHVRAGLGNVDPLQKRLKQKTERIALTLQQSGRNSNSKLSVIQRQLSQIGQYSATSGSHKLVYDGKAHEPCIYLSGNERGNSRRGITCLKNDHIFLRIQLPETHQQARADVRQ